ncbi:Hypothetical protein NCS54_00053900 [Fusarium falciforme]|uniref:Hypothetical protein n=1 Tax=Fusarium falciforme TaxID=195108 RepID=UPI0023002D21|nr:Hypothetical protein NCS54_00053900 [Fusarium falciforme]WAO83354.1 Hypothetical protein NCS54_00053900 [Fusarium falciforme]
MREDTPEAVNSPADIIIMDMELDRQSSHTVEAATDGPANPEWGESASPMLHATWTSTTTAMAKCDFCQRGRRGTLQQCRDCGLSICQECFDAGRLDRRHQLDADRVDWNQHNKNGRALKNRASRATPRFASSSAAVSAGTSAAPQSQERRQFGGVTPRDTASPSNSAPSTPERSSIGERFDHTPQGERGGPVTIRDYQGNNGYTHIQPHVSSAIEQTETENNWNYQFSQPPGQHRGYLNGSSSYHDVALASSEDPSSWNNAFSQLPAQHQQDHQGSSAYHSSAPATSENPNLWNDMFDQPQTGHQYDQMESSQNSSASSDHGEWRQSAQSSSAYYVNQPAYHDQQQPTANLPMPSHQALPSSWQPHGSPYTAASGSGLYYPDLSNYALVSIAVAPASFPQSPSRARSTPRVLPDMDMPFFMSPYALQHEPAGPPRRYEDYFDLH